MTELETAIRDALQSRAGSVEPRHDALRGRQRRRWLPPIIAAALVIALIAITLVLVTGRDTTSPSAAPRRALFVGYSWRLVQIDDRQGRLTLPSATSAELSFGQQGTMTGDDTVHSLQVRYRVVTIGYRPAGPVTSSGNGLAGQISTTLKRTLAAIGSCFSSPQLDGKSPLGAPIAATVNGDRLTLHTGDGVLTLVRAGTVVEVHG